MTKVKKLLNSGSFIERKWSNNETVIKVEVQIINYLKTLGQNMETF